MERKLTGLHLFYECMNIKEIPKDTNFAHSHTHTHTHMCVAYMASHGIKGRRKENNIQDNIKEGVQFFFPKLKLPCT